MIPLKLGPWLPDLPQLDNPGIYEARNAVPADQTYKQYLTLQTADNALAARPQGAFAARDTSGNVHIYAGYSTKLARKNGASWDTSAANYTTASDGYWRFVQWKNTVIATNYVEVPQDATVGGVVFGALASTGTAPNARHIGIIGQFVVLGDTNDGTNGVVPHRVHWPKIDDPTNWPTIGSADAVANQSGEQFLLADRGAVTGIYGGDQYGIVGQRLAITRMTYEGGGTVFRFDVIDRDRGIWFPNGAVQVGNLVFFISADGFYVTDGVTVRPIGAARVNRHFLNDVDQTYKERVYGAVDPERNCIFWIYPNAQATSGLPNRLIIYNYLEDRWGRAEDTVQLIFNSFTAGYTLDNMDTPYPNIDNIGVSFDSSFWQGGARQMAGFGSDHKLGTFAGAAAVARFETAELSPNDGGYFSLRGVRPLVTGSPSSVEVSLAKRASQDAGLSYGTAVSRNSRSGICDFRDEVRFGALRMDVTGGFDKAIGLQIDGEASSEL